MDIEIILKAFVIGMAVSCLIIYMMILLLRLNEIKEKEKDDELN